MNDYFKILILPVTLGIVLGTHIIQFNKITRKDYSRECNILITKDYESKSKKYKENMSKLPFEVLYYYNYGKMEYCKDHGKLE